MLSHRNVFCIKHGVLFDISVKRVCYISLYFIFTGAYSKIYLIRHHININILQKVNID